MLKKLNVKSNYCADKHLLQIKPSKQVRGEWKSAVCRPKVKEKAMWIAP
jgi:hypothetical protein